MSPQHSPPPRRASQRPVRLPSGLAAGGVGRRRRASTRAVERRGRGVRGTVLPAGVPAWQSRSDAFDRAAMLAFGDIDLAWHDRLTALDIAVDETPKIRAKDPWQVQWPPEVVADGPVPLSRLIPAGMDTRGRPTRARIVLFRRPIEQRAPHRSALLLLLHDILVEQVATYLGVAPEVVDPSWHRR